MKRSSGTLLYRRDAEGLKVLLVHPSGSYNRNKPWSIPKGLPDPGEELEAAARRETLEETGVIAGSLETLGDVQYRKSGKTIYCFFGAAPADAQPRCASWEVDRAEFLSLPEARSVIHPDQAAFLDRLVAQLGNAQRDNAQLGNAQLGNAQLGNAQLGNAQRGNADPDAAAGP
jgi:predicted NUDIX family NTP pyrophosphohydrolase